MTESTSSNKPQPDVHLNDHIFPVEFVSTFQKQSDLQNDSILLTTIEYLFSMQWPKPPKAPPEIDIGSSIENFVRNVVLKQEKNATNNSCQLPTIDLEVLETCKSTDQELDYNRLLKILQTVLAKDAKKKSSLDESKKG